MNKKPTLGISACLPGQPVRFDGGHKKARYITQKLSEYFELMPVCPEVEAGLQETRPFFWILILVGFAALFSGEPL